MVLLMSKVRMRPLHDAIWAEDGSATRVHSYSNGEHHDQRVKFQQFEV